ncbi:MAG: hypothetical protein HN874_02705 [Euryarchaeota archaeon]|jgi:hypothetical protein|nr:hypothetical protein [Euryarchaeota archaeon]MBT7244342.1 hypothetical protein [Euryarchaeota archaeon]
MTEEDRFEILLCPEVGDGVSTHAKKFIDSSPDGLNLIEKQVPHVETAIQLLIDGHGDIVPVSANWWYNNRVKGLSSNLVLPRREPTRVLVGEDKPEYIPKRGIIIADCDIVKRQLIRSRKDIKVMLPEDLGEAPEDVFERVEWLEKLRQEGDIDGYTTTRALHSSLPSRARRHTLGMQRQDDTRSRYIPVPLEGYTVLLTREDFPISRFSRIIDAGAALSLRLEMTILDSIEENMLDKIGLIVEQRKVRTILTDVGNRGRTLGFENPLTEWKTFTSVSESQGPKDSDPRIDIILETVSKDGMVTTSVERIFPLEESHSGAHNLVFNWNQLLMVMREVPEADKRGRMKELMDNYIEDLVSKGRLSEDRIYTPLLKEEDHD